MQCCTCAERNESANMLQPYNYPPLSFLVPKERRQLEFSAEVSSRVECWQSGWQELPMQPQEHAGDCAFSRVADRATNQGHWRSHKAAGPNPNTQQTNKAINMHLGAYPTNQAPIRKGLCGRTAPHPTQHNKQTTPKAKQSPYCHRPSRRQRESGNRWYSLCLLQGTHARYSKQVR